MINFDFKTFQELSKTEVYDLLALRFEVFVLEQHCFYLDPDGKDMDAIHLLGVEDNKLVAYLVCVLSRLCSIESALFSFC